MSHDSRLTVETEGNVTIVTFGAEFETLDEVAVRAIQESLFAATDAASPPLLVLDLKCVKFFSSSFIELLFRAWNRIHTREGCRFTLSGLTPYCEEILDVTRLNRLWEVYGSRQEALDALVRSSVGGSA